MGKKQASGSTGSNATTTENTLMLNEHSAPKSNAGTTSNDSSKVTMPKTVLVNGVEHNVVEVVHTKGRDVQEGDYPVILINGQRKAIVASEARSFSAFGNTIRAKQKPGVREERANPLPEGAVVLSKKAVAVLHAIASLTGTDAATVIDEALPLVAEAQGINETLYQRIIERALKASSASI
jgi:hypothetical protein